MRLRFASARDTGQSHPNATGIPSGTSNCFEYFRHLSESCSLNGSKRHRWLLSVDRPNGQSENVLAARSYGETFTCTQRKGYALNGTFTYGSVLKRDQLVATAEPYTQNLSPKSRCVEVHLRWSPVPACKHGHAPSRNLTRRCHNPCFGRRAIISHRLNLAPTFSARFLIHLGVMVSGPHRRRSLVSSVFKVRMPESALNTACQHGVINCSVKGASTVPLPTEFIGKLRCHELRKPLYWERLQRLNLQTGHARCPQLADRLFGSASATALPRCGPAPKCRDHLAARSRRMW